MNRDIRGRRTKTLVAIPAACLDDREDELLNPVVTAALVVRADGRVEIVEHGQPVDFLDRNELLSAFARGGRLDAFERRPREFAAQHLRPLLNLQG